MAVAVEGVVAGQCLSKAGETGRRRQPVAEALLAQRRVLPPPPGWGRRVR